MEEARLRAQLSKKEPKVKDEAADADVKVKQISSNEVKQEPKGEDPALVKERER